MDPNYNTNNMAAPGDNRNVTTGFNDPAGTHGPHQSRVGNAMDPRVDSDRDNYNVRGAGVPGGTNTMAGDVPTANKNFTTGYNDPAGTHGPHGSRAANAADPRVDSDRDNVAHAAPGAARESTAGATAAASGENHHHDQPHSGTGGGVFENIKGRIAQGIGESARGHFNASMGNLMHDEKGRAKGEATAAGGEREFANKEFGRHGTTDKAL